MVMVPLFGIATFLFIAWLCSEDRSQFPWRLTLWTLLLSSALLVLVLGVPSWGIVAPLRFVFTGVGDFIAAIIATTEAGSRFVFGDLVDKDKFGFILAVQVLPVIVFMGTLMAAFYRLRVMQPLVWAIAWVMQKSLRTSGPETLAATANVFLGQTEAPLVIRPYLAAMSRSELHSVMTGGMATIAGGVLAAYVGLLAGIIPDIAGHLLTASLLSAPAALLFAKILVPESASAVADASHGIVGFREAVKLPPEMKDRPLLEVLTLGTLDGLKLAVNVGAMLLAFTALVAFLNLTIGSVAELFGLSKEFWNMQNLLGLIGTPVAVLMGIPWEEASFAGRLIGEKTILNEFVAYLSLANEGAQFSERTRIILSYALCGFANITSMAIQIGGIGALVPERRSEIAGLTTRALLAGTLASFFTACLVAISLP